MADFQDLRQRLQQARARRRQASEAAARSRELLNRLNSESRSKGRSINRDDPRHAQERERLGHRQTETLRVLQQHRTQLAEASQAEQNALAQFAVFSDPRTAVKQLSDDYPVLLLPVRLETRFKTIKVRGAVKHQLWVRVYPDTCSIDTFEATLSDNEVQNVRLYWTGVWQAGGIEDQERGAWRGLVASHGSGRSAWLIQQYRPINLAAKPSKSKASDVLLTVPTEAALAPAEETAAAAFWRAIWLADGVKAAEDAARATLESVVGTTRSVQIADQYRPANLTEKPQAPLTKSDVSVATAFVVFPPKTDIDTKQQSWSRAPTIAVLPDRFVLIGYVGNVERAFVLGNPIPDSLVAGPDPSAPQENQLQQQDGDLTVPADIQWLVDFDRAVEVGMGFRVDLPGSLGQRGFDRLLVIGVRASADEQTARADLETLIAHHHFGRSGFSLVPQGTPTNNTEAAGSGFTRSDDADASYDDLFKKASLFEESADWLDKKDGQWLAEWLGIDGGVLRKVRYAGGSDQREARAMNVALWPATLGYWMETMMDPVFSGGAVEHTRLFFDQFVSGRGAIPSIRIGRQPYGILPVTAFSRMRWLMARSHRPISRGRPSDALLGYLERLYQVLIRIDSDWTKQKQKAAFAGKPGDAHETLLDIIGLQSGSVDYAQRYAESLEELFNRLNLDGNGELAAAVAAWVAQGAIDLLKKLGYTGAEQPDLLSKFFLDEPSPLKGPLIDDISLSEVDPIRSYTTDGRNYLEWLIDAASTSFDALRLQTGFTNNKAPSALLFLLLRHSLQLSFYNISVLLHETAGLFSAEESRAARREAPFIHVKAEAPQSESRYQLLYKIEPAVTNGAAIPIADYIAGARNLLVPAQYLQEQLRALEVLKKAPTARLERALAEHVDCCTYRFDAWMLGLVHYQLAGMRGIRQGGDHQPNTGVHLGAYAWLEDVRPEHKTLTPVKLQRPLNSIFNRRGEPPLRRDSANNGYIHAPSLNQAVTAAVLRNGYLANATAANRDTLAVNLTSERVRVALSMLEGMRNGQSLGALLGYQFERGLHDRYGLAEVDKFIYDIRKAFPLAADKMKSTRTGEGVSITAVEARNVMDGVSLVEHIKQTGNKAYPFGKKLPDASNAERDAIEAEVDRLLDSHDSVADLTIAEGVFQAVQGNYDRVAGTLDALTRGRFPPEAEVVRTPASGVVLTHRVGLHLEGGASSSPAMTPRAKGEPALNQWLATVLPPMGQVGCTVVFRDHSTNTETKREVTVVDLEVQPIDLLYLIRNETEQAMSELDDRIVQHVIDAHSPRPDGGVAIQYMETIAAPVSIFELIPLVRCLRRLVLSSRPLRASDMTLMNEATTSQDEEVFADPQRIVLIRADMQSLRSQLAALQANLTGPLSDLEHRRAEILAGSDTLVEELANVLSAVARFGLAQTGWGFAYSWKAKQFGAVLKKVEDLLLRWHDRLTEFDGFIATYDALPASAQDNEKVALLRRAERVVSTVATDPLPASPDDFRTVVLGKRALFSSRRDQFAGILASTTTSVVSLIDEVAALQPITDFDPIPLSMAEIEEQQVQFASDALRLVNTLIADVDRRLAASAGLLLEHDAAAQASARVKALQAAAKALLGEDFVLVPEFAVGDSQGNELENAMAASGDLLTYLTDTVGVDFPVDDWLYGIARVREKMHSWEEMVMLAGGFGATEPELTPIQLPHSEGDRWLALEIPPMSKIDGTEHLLYTAHYASAFQKGAHQCGLLLDEWTEVIPAPDATTGITFHYDRPNSEPPQTMLLLTPTEFRGAWQWEDVVDALNETLELAKKRAVEPADLDTTAYARFIPATISAVTTSQVTISANLAINNDVYAHMPLVVP